MPVTVSFVSVRYGDGRVEELAYRDGAFVYPYTGSTRTGDTFSLVRHGGWPSPPTVFVDLGEPAPAAAASWKLLYSVDFTAQPTQAISGPGTYTIDGKTWYLKQSNVATGDMTPFLDSRGLGWACSFGYGGSIGNLNSNSNVDYPHWFSPLSQYAAYDSSIATCIRLRAPNINATGLSGGAAVGFVSSTSDTTRHQAANTQHDAIVIRYSGGGLMSKFGTPAASSLSAELNGRNGIAVYSMPSLKNVHLVAGSTGTGWTGFPGGPGDMLVEPNAAIAYSGYRVTLPRPNPGIFLMGYGAGMPGVSFAFPLLEIWGYKS